jgi:magnesium transporter
MLSAFPAQSEPAETSAPHPGAAWIDLLEPTETDISLVEQTTGLHVPSLAELSEIESSSRLYAKDGALYLTAMAVLPEAGGDISVAPFGFVLSRDRLITVRYTRIPVFEVFAEQCRRTAPAQGAGLKVFLGLLEAIVDRSADTLERVGEELDRASHRIFHRKPEDQRPARLNRELRALLRSVGRAGDLVSKIRDTLLTLGRIVPFVATNAADWIPADQKGRFKTLRNDIVSLNDYDAHLTNKAQFLLDATLGFINIEQNNIIKVLTVASVVGIPPTFFASMYGMNFKWMPELEWAWGYPYALGLIFLSAIVPLLLFRWRGWL